MGKRQVHSPLQNNWLFSCPTEMPTRQIMASLAISKQPIIEVSAQHWKEPWQMANDLLLAYEYPHAYLHQPGEKVNWDSLHSLLFVKGIERGQVQGGRLVGQRFIGEAFIIRDSQAGALENVAILVDMIHNLTLPLQKKPHLFPNTRLVLVLEGWISSTFEARIHGRRLDLLVNPLPDTG